MTWSGVSGMRMVFTLALGCAVVAALLMGPTPAQADDPAPVVVRITKGGAVSVTRADTKLATTSLATDSIEQQAKALHVVQAALTTLMKAPENRGPDGTSVLRLQIEADRSVPWKHVAWIMQVGATPEIKIWQITLKRRGDAAYANVTLPRDRGLRPGASREFIKIKLKYFRKNKRVAKEAFTRLRINNERADSIDFPRSALSEDEYARLYDQALVRAKSILTRKKAQTLPGEDVVVEFANVPPDGGDVPFVDVFAGVELVQGMGFTELVFEGAAAPGFGTHRHDSLEDITETPEDVLAPTVTTVVGADGRVYVRDVQGRNLAGFMLGGDDDSASLAKFIDTLAAVVHRPIHRNMNGSSRFVLRLDVKGTVPWKHVQWLMQAAAHPRNKIYKLDLRLDAPGELAPMRVDLPLDRGLDGPFVAGKPEAKVKVRLFRKEIGTPKAWTKIRVDALTEGQELPVFELRGDGPGAANMKRSDVLTALTQTLQAHHRKTPNATVEIIAPPPSGGAVPFADVREVVMITKALGFTSLVFEGAAPPMMHRRK